MDTLALAAILLSAAVIAASLVAILLERRKNRSAMEKIRTMLNEAMSGTFTERVFDESMLSALESELADYLSSCAESARQLTEEKNRIKELISDISHQTKTPIANILLYAQLLEERKLPEDCAVCVRALSSQAEKLSFLIGALIKTSRLEAGIINVTPAQNRVDRLIARAAEQVLPEVEAKGITLTVEATDAEARFDPKWTAEALFNLMDNAVKYTPSGGFITVELTVYELFCRIDVTDTGMGIPEEEQSKVFNRFYRSPAVADQAGAGLGLYLCREILTAEGGYLKLSSSPGRGSVFSLFLPLSGNLSKPLES